MSAPILVVGSKNSSSWSLRAWLLLKQIGIAFEEVVVPLRQPDTAERILAHSPSGKLPVLIVEGTRIWDSLAIAEFLAEHEPTLWPTDARERAFARAISAEMHSGFQNLRRFMPMDFTARFGPPGRLLRGVEADICRIVQIWAACRKQRSRSGPFLLGEFTIADAMFAPVCSRFVTYAVPLDPADKAYVAHIMALPAVQEWGRAATAEVMGKTAPIPAEGAVGADRLPPELRRPLAALPTEAAAPPEPSPAVAETRPVPPRPAAPAAAAPSRPAASPSPAKPPHPPSEPVPAPEPTPVPAPEPMEVLRRPLRPIPSTIMVKPIGDGTRRRR